MPPHLSCLPPPSCPHCLAPPRPRAQPFLNRLFTKGQQKAQKHRAARLTYSRDAAVNYLPTKLYGAQAPLQRLADA